LTERRVRHLLGLSGGKDSAALAIYMRDRVPEMEYFFCDTGHELPEVYEYLNRLEAYLGRRIVRLDNGGRDFDHYLAVYKNFLPSPQARWCTKHLKLEPFEHFAGDDEVYSYVAIRADEDRGGYHSTKPNITPVFPFKAAGLVKRDVIRLLESSGLGLPEYYKWRSRSGCYFCFFQRKIEWVHLLEKHPELFEQAKQYEKRDPETGEPYTWSQGESLEELSRPERIAQIKSEYAEQLGAAESKSPNMPLIHILAEADWI
jgi:hypothetical protein